MLLAAATVGSRNLGKLKDSSYEVGHQFVVHEPHKPGPRILLTLRLSRDAYEDDFPKIAERADAATLEELLLRHAIRRIDDGLRDGSIEASTSWIEFGAADFELLREMIHRKDRDYQVNEGRDLFCSASSSEDIQRITTIGLRTFARTSSIGVVNAPCLTEGSYAPIFAMQR